MRWIVVALYRHRRERGGNRGEVVGRERDICRADVLLQASQLGGARDRHEPPATRAGLRRSGSRRCAALSGDSAPSVVESSSRTIIIAAMIHVLRMIVAAATLAVLAGPASETLAQSTAPVSLRILAINDFHGNLMPPPGGIRIADPNDKT